MSIDEANPIVRSHGAHVSFPARWKDTDTCAQVRPRVCTFFPPKSSGVLEGREKGMKEARNEAWPILVNRSRKGNQERFLVVLVKSQKEARKEATKSSCSSFSRFFSGFSFQERRGSRAAGLQGLVHRGLGLEDMGWFDLCTKWVKNQPGVGPQV